MIVYGPRCAPGARDMEGWIIALGDRRGATAVIPVLLDFQTPKTPATTPVITRPLTAAQPAPDPLSVLPNTRFKH